MNRGSLSSFKSVVMFQDATGMQVSIEVPAMLWLQEQSSRSVGSSAPVALLDWYDLGVELVLVRERPVPVKDLRGYIMGKDSQLPEEEAKVNSWTILLSFLLFRNWGGYIRDLICNRGFYFPSF